MYAIVSQWDPQQQSQSSFCKAHGLRHNTFSYWYKKYKSEQGEASGSFVSMEVLSESAYAPVSGLRIKYPNGVIVQLDELVDPQYISQLIKMGV